MNTAQSNRTTILLGSDCFIVEEKKSGVYQVANTSISGEPKGFNRVYGKEISGFTNCDQKVKTYGKPYGNKEESFRKVEVGGVIFEILKKEVNITAPSIKSITEAVKHFSIKCIQPAGF